MISILDFIGLIVDLVALNHLKRFERSIFIFDFNKGSFRVRPSATKQTSSAKNQGVQMRADGKSLIQEKKKKIKDQELILGVGLHHNSYPTCKNLCLKQKCIVFV